MLCYLPGGAANNGKVIRREWHHPRPGCHILRSRLPALSNQTTTLSLINVENNHLVTPRLTSEPLSALGESSYSFRPRAWVRALEIPEKKFHLHEPGNNLMPVTLRLAPSSCL